MPQVRFTHLLNPFNAKPGSEHDVAQRMTFQALRNAVAESERHGIGVEALAVVEPQDLGSVEAPARAVPAITRTIQDVHPMTPPRTFPLVADLLNAAAERGRGDYIVFTNVDISPQPFLYRVLDDLMRRDPSRAVIVNRRTIPKVTADPSQISLAYQQTGESHHGHDCFVFPRAWVPKLILNDVCIGAPWWDYALLANLDALSGFRMFTYLHQRLTFHLGDDRAWTSLSEYDVFNQQQVLRVIEALEQRHGKPPIDSRFAWVAQRTRQQPASQRSLAIKIKRKMRALHELGVLARARGMAKGSSFYAGTEQVPPGPPQPMTAAG